MDPVEKLLAHHGIKGMHWGIRRNDAQLRREGSRTSSDHRTAQQLRQKKRSELTNKQLKTLNERLNLEQNHIRLNPSKVKRGTIAATSILATVGIATKTWDIVHSPAGKAAIEAGKKFAKKKM